jgi:hypothetical protein
MERFLDRRDQENSKTQGGKGQIRKNHKNKEKMGERKRRDVFSIDWDCPFATLPSGEPLVWESPLQHIFTRFVNQHKEHG